MGMHTHLSLVDGKYAHRPNMVLVPADRKTFPVRLQLDCECEDTHVVGAADKGRTHEWCVLDEKLRQVEVGGGGKKSTSKRMAPHVSRTVMGGGASNPEQITVDLTGTKLKHGAGYTLIVKSYGTTAACDFVALHEPAKAKAKARKKPARKRKAKAKKKAVKRKVKRKASAVKKKTKGKAKVVKKKAKAKTRAVKKKVVKKTRGVKKRKAAKKK